VLENKWHDDDGIYKITSPVFCVLDDNPASEEQCTI